MNVDKVRRYKELEKENARLRKLVSDMAIANQVMLAGHVRVEEYANIGGGVGVHHFTTVGSCAFVGGLARITKDVPPFMIVEGNPAEVRALNAIAMVRRGYSAEHIDAVKDAYKRLYRDNCSPMADRLADLRVDYPEVPAIARLCDSLTAAADVAVVAASAAVAAAHHRA